MNRSNKKYLLRILSQKPNKNCSFYAANLQVLIWSSSIYDSENPAYKVTAYIIQGEYSVFYLSFFLLIIFF